MEGELHKIYNDLKDRYTAVNEEIQLVNGNNDMMAMVRRMQPGEEHLGVVYTCLTGPVVRLARPLYQDDRWIYYCYTDDEGLIAGKTFNGWKIRPLVYNDSGVPHDVAWHMANPQELFPDEPHVVWVDGSHPIDDLPLSLQGGDSHECNDMA